ncbi:Vps5 C terminal like-domain-containing protein [Dipodascopsis uninucleata]
MDPEDLTASQWDDLPSSNPLKHMSPAASPPPIEDNNSPVAKEDDEDDKDNDNRANPEGEDVKRNSTDDEEDLAQKPSTAGYTAQAAAASRARALRMARSRKASLPAGSTVPVAASSASVLFENIDPVANPLGPLVDDPPEEDSKDEEKDVQPEQLPTNANSWASRMKTVGEEAQAAASISILNPSLTATSSSIARHIPVEQAANPTFEISVGDPIKVGDLASAHTVYNVHTKTTSKAYRYSDFSVTRRYKDFRWIYHQLNHNHPGIIIPAPPEKQIVGRFDENFVEARRTALEKMLNKIAQHPVLQHDPDLKLFLESDTLNSDIRNKERLLASGEGSSKGGFIGSIGSAFQFTGKFVETDEWFMDKKAYIEALDLQLRALSKALDTVIVQRKELADSTAEFAVGLQLLSEVELSRPLSSALAGLSDVEQRVRDLHERQGLQDMLTLGDTVDEYVRMIDSIKAVFIQRQKSFLTWQAAEQELIKRQQYLARALRQGKTPQDRLNLLQEEVTEHERRVYNLRVAYDDICKTIKIEFDKFQKEKIEDFRASVETYLESAVESQKEAIELWETFYERQGFSEPQPPQAPQQV